MGNLNEYYDGPLDELWRTLRAQIVASHLTVDDCLRPCHPFRAIALPWTRGYDSARSLSLAVHPPKQHRMTRSDRTEVNNIKNRAGGDPVKAESGRAESYQLVQASASLENGMASRQTVVDQ